MEIRGHHRVRSGARLLAVPVVGATLVAVVAAVLVGHAGWIAAAAGLAVVSCVLVAFAFDRELVSTRRSHAEDRARLARLYAERFAAWRRTDRASQVAAAAEDEEPTPGGVSAAAPDPIVASSLAPGPRLTANAGTKPERAGKPTVRPAVEPESATTSESATIFGPFATTSEPITDAVPVTDAGPIADPESFAEAEPFGEAGPFGDAEPFTGPEPFAASEPAAAVASGDSASNHDAFSERDLWPDLADAPTVVDLAGWEGRVREATEHRSVDGAVSGPADADDRRYA